MEEALDLVRKLCWDKTVLIPDRRRYYSRLSKANAMSVADYGPSSQTLTFLDPEDDLGSLGIGADTQVMTIACVFVIGLQHAKTGRWLRLSLHPAKPVPASGGICQVKIIKIGNATRHFDLRW